MKTVYNGCLYGYNQSKLEKDTDVFNNSACLSLNLSATIFDCDRICSQFKAWGHFPLHIKFDAGSGEGGCLATLTEGIAFSLNMQTGMVMSADQREAEKIHDPRSESVS